MNRLYIALGKVGDLCNLLPLLYADSQKGEAPGLMVAAEFASLLDGVSYVEPVIYNGPHYEIAKAVAKARELCADVVCVQVVGPVEEVKEYTYEPNGQQMAGATSFNKESWKVAGRLKEWDEGYPLVFDKRDSAREDALLKPFAKKKKKLVLLSTGGKSSPFPHAKLLAELVRLKCAALDLHVIDLGEIKAERFYDLLALYERATAVISTDSAPLHLARACPTLPVFAFTNDKPMLWNGSSWQPNHIFYCRYGDFQNRISEFLLALESIEEGLEIPKEPQVFHVWNEYEDPSVIRPSWTQMPISLGMCGRDSAQHHIGDPKRVPFLKDCVRMALQRARDKDFVCVSRPGTKFSAGLDPDPSFYPASYSYRMERNGEWTPTFSPTVDMFCASKTIWKTLLPDIPDFLFGNDKYWDQTLLQIFQKAKAKDLTGAVYRERMEPKAAPKADAIPNRVYWNLNLYKPFAVFHRYPKVSQQIETIPLDQTKLFRYGYNCTLADHEGAMLLGYRYHETGLSTKLAIARVHEGGQVEWNRKLEMNGHSNEDPSFFKVGDGTLWMSWVETYFPIKMIGSIHFGAVKGNVIAECTKPNYGENDGEHMEKNWVFFTANEAIYFLYQCSPKQVVVRWSGKFEEELTSPGAYWPYGPIRGGTCPIPYEGKLLRFFHSRLDNDIHIMKHRYYVGACLMNPQPPFETVVVSKKPIIYGSEDDDLTPEERKACWAYNTKVVFPLGAVARKDHWIVSLGENHNACVLAKVRPKDLNL